MGIVIKNDDLEKVADSVKVDDRRRVLLPRKLVKQGVIYHIYANKLGQIVLDPQATIPASELWVFEDKDTLASIDKGMAESADGQTAKRGSFAEYVEA